MIVGGSRAWAVLAPGEGWTEVNSSEVAESGKVSSARSRGVALPEALTGAGGFEAISRMRRAGGG